jgi:hypothetical protein
VFEPIKRRVFVSYHHRGDQWYYNEFSRMFSDTFEVFQDTSLEREFDSDNHDYVRWAIAQNHITGSSCTIVLCGAETHARKYVDWEIKATLDRSHGLIGVRLPTLQIVNDGSLKPARLQDNIDSGFAKWIGWDRVSDDLLRQTIESAVASPTRLIVNDRLMHQRNR